MENPIDLFRLWYQSARKSTQTNYPGAVCLSTVDEQGAPDARFVDLKEVTEGGFVFCTHLDSVKGREIRNNPTVALTFWWPGTERQVRVVGPASAISESLAEELFHKRSRDAQLATLASRQSSGIDHPSEIHERVRELESKFSGRQVQRPADWGGYRVKPTKIEFLEFKSNRLHERKLFSLNGTEWQYRWLQP